MTVRSVISLCPCCRYEDAVRHFRVAVRLDVGNATYLSNLAAALVGLKSYDEALASATRCTQLKPGWAKGWARMGAALMGREDFAEVIFLVCF